MDKTHHDYWKTFYEYLAKNYIELTFEPDFCNLIKNECPDFKSGKIGLEVVTAVTETQNALNSLLRKYLNKGIEEIPDGLLTNLGFHKESIYQVEVDNPLFCIASKSNGRLFFLKRPNDELLFAGQIGFIPNDEFNSQMIVNKINEKIAKLNNNYELCSQNVLGVYIEYPIIPEIINYQDEMARNMQDIIKKELLANLIIAEKTFDTIFICFPDIVYKYAADTNVFSYEVLETPKITSIVNKTRNDILLL